MSKEEEEDMDSSKSEEEVDRISNLPDSLIHHILSFLLDVSNGLSFLSLKHVAQTSVLSKRWSYIWITVPNLDFREWGCFEPTPVKTNNFMDFVDGTLHRRHSGANIQRFSITWHKHLNDYRVNSWIISAVRHNVQHLSLCLRQDKPLIIPRSLFTCESLISLKLQIAPIVCLPNHISFPKLKCLHLDGVEFSNEYWSEKLFSNCPVLEDFGMEQCTWFGMPNFCISTPALKHFKIDNWESGFLPLGEDDGLQGCTLRIHAPKLESFYYHASVAKEYVLTTFPLLDNAVVYFRFKPYDATRTERICHGAAIRQLLLAIANAKRLVVSDDTLQALSFADGQLEKLPTFHNTKWLLMFEEVTADKALVALLKATPNLESLTFVKTGPEEDDVAETENNHVSEDDGAHNLVTDPGCLFLHLKSVSFEEFIGNPVEVRWVKLILKYAKALETMSISSQCYSFLLSTERKEELMEEIPSLPRASTSCVFKFPSWRRKRFSG